METLKVYMNGAFVPEHEARVSVYDHGLLYGDGADLLVTQVIGIVAHQESDGGVTLSNAHDSVVRDSVNFDDSGGSTQVIYNATGAGQNATLLVENSQFMLYAQGIAPVAATAPDLNACEALVRMKQPDGRVVTPEEFLAAASAKQPVLVILEDLHWGDLPTVRLMDGALRQVHVGSWMLLAVARPEIDSIFPNLWADRQLLRMHLKGLTERTCRDLISRLLGHKPDNDTITESPSRPKPKYVM